MVPDTPSIITPSAIHPAPWLVIEAGQGTMGGLAYAAGVRADIVKGVTNSPPYGWKVLLEAVARRPPGRIQLDARLITRC